MKFFQKKENAFRQVTNWPFQRHTGDIVEVLLSPSWAASHDVSRGIHRVIHTSYLSIELQQLLIICEQNRKTVEWETHITENND